MKPLATQFRSNGFDLTQLKRVGVVALFEKTMPGIARPSYEVVIVQRHGERVIAGNTIPAAEAMPGAEQWGQKGWSCVTLERAHAKFAEVLAKNPPPPEGPPEPPEVTLADLCEGEA